MFRTKLARVAIAAGVALAGAGALITPASAATSATPAPLTTAPKAGPAPVAAPKPAQHVTYKVRRGDNLSRIARRNHTTVKQLVALNTAKYPSLKKNPHRIYSGWLLVVR
jgi:LysM repeat protein